MEWISIEDKLPEKCQDVLVCNTKTSFIRIAYIATDGTWRQGACVVEVTHWMPLPEPPKRKRQFTYESSGIHDDSGYVIYDLDGKRIEPWDLVNALNNPLPDGLALLCGLGMMGKNDDANS